MADSRADTDTIDPGQPPAAAASRLAEGTLFADRYRIGRVLGTGGFAIVYAAWDTHVRQEIALKILRPERESERTLTRFRREVNIARQLKAPNLVRVYDIGQVESSVWISMELVEGRTLRDEIRGGQIPIERAIEIGRQILAALQGLHEHGVIHRDVKPGNIMITPEGDARLMDLGLARYYAREETLATTTENVVGTLEYLSPEQALGEELDPRSDLYSFGLVLYEMLAGRLPFGELSTLGHLIAHVSRQPPEVRTFRPDTPAWLGRLVMRLLERHRENRYGSAALALHDLGARRSPFRVRFRDWTYAATATAIVVVLASVGYLGWRQWSDSRFDRFVTDGTEVGVALDRKGRELWRRKGLVPGVRATLARFEHGKPPVIVGVPGDQEDPTSPEQRVLSIIDPQTGNVLRRHTLDEFVPVFGEQFSNTFAASDFDTVDVDHDGIDEVVGLWTHSPYWPSGTVYYDPAVARPQHVFYASGYHRLVGTADVNGDGIDELILFGVNNRLGWHASLAAVNVARIRRPKSLLDEAIVASTPDAGWSPHSDLALAWYALLPPFGPGTRLPLVDHERRVVVIDGPDQEIVVDFDGFVKGTGDGRPATDRKAARDTAYRHVREHFRLSASGDWDASVGALGLALAAAREADDRTLAAWAEQTSISALIRSRRFDEAESLLNRLVSVAADDSNIAWEAAVAYHVTGETERAIRWYRSVLRSPVDVVAGRKLYEFLEGAVFALGEVGRWDEARGEIRAFRSRAHDNVAYGAIYEGWIDWRETGRAPAAVGEGEPELALYLSLEYALTRSDDPAAVLERANEARALLSGKSVLLDSVVAECLLRLERTDEALQVATRAAREAGVLLETETLVRAHYDLIVRRMIRAAEASGRDDEAGRARAALEDWTRARRAQ